MKAMSKVLVLATITLMSASAFAADGVGEKKDSKDCVTVSDKGGDKAKAAGTATTEEGKKDAAKTGKIE